MTALLIILAVLAVLNLTPIGARVLYDERGLRVRAVLGLIEFEVLPGKTKTPEQMEAEEEKKKKKSAEKAKKKKKKAARGRLRTRGRGGEAAPRREA